MIDILAELDAYWERHGVEAMSELLIREQLNRIVEETDLRFQWRSAPIKEMTKVLRETLHGGMDVDNLAKHRIGHPMADINGLRAELPVMQQSVLRCINKWSKCNKADAQRIAENRLMFMAALCLLAVWDLRQWFTHGERAGLHCRIKQGRLKSALDKRDAVADKRRQKRFAKRVLNVERISGWGESPTSQAARYHYFSNSTVSLCGHLLLWHGKIYPDGELPQKAKKCILCVRKLAELKNLLAGREAKLHKFVPMHQTQAQQVESTTPPPVGECGDCPTPQDNAVLPPDSAAAIIHNDTEPDKGATEKE